MQDLVIRGGTVVTMDAQRRVGAFDVHVRGSRIVAVGPSLPVPSGAQVVDATGRAVIPGLVHTHVHLCQVLFRHMAEDRALLPWLRERIWPLEAAHDAESLRTSTALGLAELLLSGATCALDMGTVHHHDEVFSAARDLGFRLCSGKAMMDAGGDVPAGLRETTEDSIRESDRLRDTWDGACDGRLTYAYAPRFVLSCSPELLRTVAERVQQGARLHTHASENPDEVAAVREATGLDNVEYLDRLGLLTERSTLAHAVHLSDDEVSLLARSRASVAHCPSANLKLASGIADVPRLLEAGVNVGLGADGAPCNNNLDLWREMKLAGLLPRLKYGPAAIEAQRVFELATIGGARALGLGDEIGSLEAGKRADLAIVDLQVPHVQPLPDEAGPELYTALVYASQASDVRTVLVDGAMVVRERRLLTGNLDAICAQAKVDARRVRERALGA